MAKTIKMVPTDPLTGLTTYDAFMDDLGDALSGTAGNGYAISLCLVDIDYFGRANDELGEGVGDAIIECLSETLCSALGTHGTVYRYGGDALMALLPGVEKEQAFLLLESARDTFDTKQEITTEDQTLHVTTSFSGGVAASPADGSDRDALIRKCSDSLYRAKVSGRNRVCLAREEKMVTKTTYYRQGQLEGLTRLAKRENMNEASLLREAMDDLLRKRNA